MKKIILLFTCIIVAGIICFLFVYQNKKQDTHSLSPKTKHDIAKPGIQKDKNTLSDIELKDSTRVRFDTLEKFEDSSEFVRKYPNIEQETDSPILLKPDRIIFREPKTHKTIREIIKKDNSFTKSELYFFAHNPTNKTLLKKTYDYWIWTKNFLYISIRNYPYQDTVSYAECVPFRTDIYDSKGNFVLEVPELMGASISPDEQSIIVCDGPACYAYTQPAIQKLSFYNRYGQLQRTYGFDQSECPGNFNAQFSEDGKYVIVKGLMPENSFRIYSANGKLRKQVQGFKNFNSWTAEIFLSDDLDYSCCTMFGDTMTYFNNSTETIVWGKSSDQIRHCYFESAGKCLVIETRKYHMGKHVKVRSTEYVKVLSKTSGKNLIQMENASILKHENDRYFIKSKGKYFVFKIKHL